MNKKQLIPAITSVLAALATVFAEPVHAWVSANPEYAAGIASLITVIANFVKSPTQS